MGLFIITPFLIIYLCLFLMGMLSMTAAIAHYQKYCNDVISLGFNNNFFTLLKTHLKSNG